MERRDQQLVEIGKRTILEIRKLHSYDSLSDISTQCPKCKHMIKFEGSTHIGLKTTPPRQLPKLNITRFTTQMHPVETQPSLPTTVEPITVGNEGRSAAILHGHPFYLLMRS